MQITVSHMDEPRGKLRVKIRATVPRKSQSISPMPRPLQEVTGRELGNS
jgi:hypothetical protein